MLSIRRRAALAACLGLAGLFDLAIGDRLLKTPYHGTLTLTVTSIPEPARWGRVSLSNWSSSWN